MKRRSVGRRPSSYDGAKPSSTRRLRIRFILTGVLCVLLVTPALSLMPHEERTVALFLALGAALIFTRAALRRGTPSISVLLGMCSVFLASVSLVMWTFHSARVTTVQPLCNTISSSAADQCPPARNYTWVIPAISLLALVELSEVVYLLWRDRPDR